VRAIDDLLASSTTSLDLGSRSASAGTGAVAARRSLGHRIEDVGGLDSSEGERQHMVGIMGWSAILLLDRRQPWESQRQQEDVGARRHLLGFSEE
jgi:hypothetical protein